VAKPAPTIVAKPAPTIVAKPAPTIVAKPAPTIDHSYHIRLQLSVFCPLPSAF
jgi:hypothetical protein